MTDSSASTLHVYGPARISFQINMKRRGRELPGLYDMHGLLRPRAARPVGR